MIKETQGYALYDVAKLNSQRSGVLHHYVVLHRTPEDAVKLIRNVLKNNDIITIEGELVVQEECAFNQFANAVCIVDSADIVDIHGKSVGNSGEQFRYELEVVENEDVPLAIMRKYENVNTDSHTPEWRMTDRLIHPFLQLEHLIPHFRAFANTI